LARICVVLVYKSLACESKKIKKGEFVLVVILYDGIGNSVFSSQVLDPLLAMIDKDINLEITLISFEKEKIDALDLPKRIPACNRLDIIIGKKLPFLGQWSLLFAAYQLKNILSRLDYDQVLARGPLAGFITLWALEKIAKKFPDNVVPEVTIQARGLCAEEYRYDKFKRPSNFIVKFFNRVLYSSLKNIEFLVYSTSDTNIKIEAVSPALKEYLVKTFQAPESKIIIATHDIPKHFSPEEIAAWRKKVREQLHIPEDTHVYCYSGSYKPWQCPSEMVEYITELLKTNKKIFFLVLSPDKDKFLLACSKQHIDKHYYIVLNVSAHDVYQYLAAGDYGLLFREKDIVNWVSRPTKMLEYQSVGLKIIHNNTISWLTNHEVS